jgi:predicted nucleotidyltransferase
MYTAANVSMHGHCERMMCPDSEPSMVDVAPFPYQRGLTASDREQIAQVVAALQDVLGDDLIGAYLHGSAVLGGFRARSDIDVLAVSARRMNLHQKERLVARLLDMSGPDPAAAPPRPIELTIVVGSEIRPWRYPPTMDFQYGEWWRERFEGGEVEPWPSRTNPDVAVLVTMTILGDATVAGPPPVSVFDPVPRADFTEALVAGIWGLLEDVETDTTNVVLTLARIWNGVVSATVQSKDSAAEWALPRLDPEHRAVLAHARDRYLGVTDEGWNELRDQIRPFADKVIGEIESARPAITP